MRTAKLQLYNQSSWLLLHKKGLKVLNKDRYMYKHKDGIINFFLFFLLQTQQVYVNIGVLHQCLKNALSAM